MMRLFPGYITLCGMLVVGCTDSANQKNPDPKTITTQPAAENRLAGQYIVVLKEGGSQAVLIEVFKPYGIKSIKDLSKGRYVIILEQDPGPEEITKQAATSTEIEYVQPNYIYRTMEPVQERPINKGTVNNRMRAK